MSEVIVRMEMPDRCPCELAVDNNGWFSPCFAYYGIPSREKDFDDCIENGTRPSWCPIICELPEQHGDLIDRDHFKENLDMVCDAGGWLEPVTQAVRVYCKKQVDAEKTIAPATKGVEHE